MTDDERRAFDRDYAFWRDEYLAQDPDGAETQRLFELMLQQGNPQALQRQEDLDAEARRLEYERLERPLNTFGSRELIGDHIHQPAPEGPDHYPNEWVQISAREKEAADWRCVKCGFRQRGSGSIQVHHIDRNKANNDTLNLEVLCAICHGNEHGGFPTWDHISADQRSELQAHHRKLRHLNTETPAPWVSKIPKN